MTGLIILAIIVAAVGYAIFVYNDLVSKRQLKEEGWSGIDVQLKRRTDMIPNLMETVKGYMKGLFAKLGVADRTQAAMRGLERGFVHLD